MSSARYCELVPINEGDGVPLLAEGSGIVFPSLSTVQFSAPIFYADQEEAEMSIDVVRIDALDSRVTAKYCTKDISAKAGDTYKAVSGEVVFEPGETLKTIVVPLVDSGIWSATVEFNVLLSDPGGCNLGVYLHACRVKVIDNHAFPSNKFREELVSGDAKAVPFTYLFWEYFKWNVRSAKLLVTILLVIAMDQLKNAHMILLLYCDMYLVNVVVNPEAPKEELLLPSRVLTGCLVASAHVVPPVVLYLCDLAKVRFDLHGYSTLHLQRNVYRKSMNLSHGAAGGELTMRIHTDAPKLAGGFQAALNLLQVSVNVGMHFYFVVAKNPRAVPFALGLPAAILAWGLLRGFCAPLIGVSQEAATVANYVGETQRKLELVRTFFLRPQMNAEFVKLAGNLQAKGVKQATQHLNTNFVLHCIAPVCICAFIATKVPQVLSGDLELGTFLATITMMKNISQLTLSAYTTGIDICDSYPALRNLANFLNMETELAACKAANRLRRSSTARLSRRDGAGGSASLKSSCPHLDELPCLCKDVFFSFGDGAEIFTNVNLCVAQGKIIEVKGAHQSGKYTLMRLLGQQIFPTGGTVFMPVHLRTLLVQREAQFFDWSLTRNLTVGCPDFSSSDVPRLKSILCDLKLQKLNKVIDDEMASGDQAAAKDSWSKALSHTDLQLLSLARALFMNPEILVIPNIFASFSLSHAKDVAAAITEHRSNRGLHMPAKTAANRRPRTVFYSTEDEHPHGFAEVVWVMEKTGALNGRGNPVWTVRDERAKPAD